MPLVKTTRFILIVRIVLQGAKWALFYIQSGFGSVHIQLHVHSVRIWVSVHYRSRAGLNSGVSVRRASTVLFDTHIKYCFYIFRN